MTTENENAAIIENPADIKVIKKIDTTQYNVDAHADTLIEAIPEVTESAISAHNDEQAAITESAAGLVDKNGNSFDPSIHQVDKDGAPKESSTGKLMLKRGRKAGSTSAVKSKVGNAATQPMQDSGQTGLNENQLQQAAVTGKVSAHMLINVSMMIGGKDFAPVVDKNTGIDEKLALESAFTDYYIATGKVDMPPNVALLLTIGMYALPRFAMPTVQTNLKAKGGKIYTWWQNRKLKKQIKKQNKEASNNGAQSDFGNDGKRENDTSETTSAGLQK